MSPSDKGGERYKHSSNAAWRRVDKETIILDLDTSVYYSLNDTGAFIWERVGAGTSTARVVEELCAEFDVKPETASRDTSSIIEQLRKEKLLLPA
jgi:hypothetical protein